MSSGHKVVVKTRHREQFSRVKTEISVPRVKKDTAAVTLTQPINMTLTLPVTTWEHLVIFLTTEINQLRQQFCVPPKDSKIVATETIDSVSRRKRKDNVKSCKHRVHKCRARPNIVVYNCQHCERDREPSKSANLSCDKGDNKLFPATSRVQAAKQTATVERKVNILPPTHRHSSATAELSTCAVSQSGNQCLCNSVSKFTTQVNVLTQTDVCTETKSTSTKRRGRQVRQKYADQEFQHPERVLPLEKSRRGIQPRTEPRKPGVQYKERLLRPEPARLEKVPTNKVQGQRQSPVRPQNSVKQEIGQVLVNPTASEIVTHDLQPICQEKPVRQDPEVAEIKIPSNSHELLVYTENRIKELTEKHLISQPLQLQNYCVFCQDSHNVSACPKLPRSSNKYRCYGYQECRICSEHHDMVNCEWIPIVDLLTSLPEIEQHRLGEVCPYLQELTADPKLPLLYMFAWSAVRPVVERMSAQNFTLKYCKELREKIQEKAVTENQVDLFTQPTSVGCARQTPEQITQPTESLSQTKVQHYCNPVNGVAGSSKMGQTNCPRGAHRKSKGHCTDQRGPAPTSDLFTSTKERLPSQIASPSVSQHSVDEVKQHQGYQVMSKPDPTILYNIPQNSQQLLTFTLFKLKELKRQYEDSSLYNKSMFCRVCNDNKHGFSSCPTLKLLSDSVAEGCSTCCICNEVHATIACEWNKVIETIDKLSTEPLKELLIQCPFLDSVGDTEDRLLINALCWERIAEKVQSADSKIFKVTSITSEAENPTEHRNLNVNKVEEVLELVSTQKEIEQLSDRKTFEFPCMESKIEKRLPPMDTHMPTPSPRQCYFCRDFSHLVKDCILYKQKKSRQKKSQLTQVSKEYKNEQHNMVCKEKLTNDQCISSRSVSERSGSTKPPETKRSPTSSPRIFSRPENRSEDPTKTKTPEISEKLSAPPALPQGEKPVNQFQLKVPENSQQLANYTQHAILQLVTNNDICIPETKIQFCVYCRRDTHNFTECKQLKSTSAERKRKNKTCLMCECDHEMLICEFIQALDVAHSVNTHDRQKLFEVCPYLEEIVRRPTNYILFKFAWYNQEKNVRNMDWRKLGLETGQLNK
ncbi:hypothetical protein BsWGS_13089 [Bradybaena similaris]